MIEREFEGEADKLSPPLRNEQEAGREKAT
jgi:hypothetical protein